VSAESTHLPIDQIGVGGFRDAAVTSVVSNPSQAANAETAPARVR